MIYTLQTLLSRVKGFGPKIIEQADVASVKTVGDFLLSVPSRYIDRSHQVTTDQLKYFKEKTLVTVLGQVTSITGQRYGRRTNQKATFQDETGRTTLRWFNSPFVIGSLKKNQQYYFSGEYSPKYKSISQPTFEPVRTTQLHTGRLVPFYPQLIKMADGTRRRLLHHIVENLEVVGGELEKSLRSINRKSISTKSIDKENSELDSAKDFSGVGIETDLRTALEQIHFPDTDEKTISARYRLALEEILTLMHSAQAQKKEWALTNSSYSLPPIDHKKYPLPFSLTTDQIQSIEDISQDLGKKHPMNRLLLGDVGSGKTIVAGIAAAHSIEHGHSTCLIAPTKILVDQHLESLKKHLPGLEILALTGQHKLQASDLKKPALFIGTHALINRLHEINPALVIFDEQHRFGVNQRSQIQDTMTEKKIRPHTLTMSATPIPRSLMLTIFSHLEISQIKEMPPGRQPTKSWLTPEKKRADALEWMRKYLENNRGSLAIVVCPFINPSKVPGLKNIKSAVATTEELKKKFPQLKIELIHGRLTAGLGQKIIDDAKNGKIDILVTTTVVEVGMDLPNADVMIIEAAERFGLASLHQLRGRVGRRGQRGYCLLFTTPELATNSSQNTSSATKRLKSFTQISSGQKLAELDLKNRGAGNLFGTRQHGFDTLRFFSWTDYELISLAQKINSQLDESWQSQLPLQPKEQTIIVPN